MDMMVMGANLPPWVTPLAWTFLVLAVLSAAAITFDIYVLGHRQPARAMGIVWPVTALYLGPLAIWAYARWGRPGPAGPATRRAEGEAVTSGAPAITFGLPGGAASVIAHLVGVPLVALTGWTIAGLDMWAMVAVIAVVALGLLFAFEYRSRAAATAHLPTPGTVGRAAAIAALTIVAFDVGMVGWMVLLHLGALMPSPSDVSFVFLMQLGVVIGLVTAYPVVARLGRRAAPRVPA